MSLIELFFRFAYVGLFTVGGGLASIPLMLQAIVAPGLVSEPMFYNMVAISESTPGPIGVNIATYIGYQQYGIIGGIVTTLGITIPCFFISYLVSRAFQKFSDTKAVKASLYGIRAAVAGMIATAAYGVFRISIITWDRYVQSGNLTQICDWKALLIFTAIFALILKFKKHPVVYIILGGVLGFLF